MPIPELEAWMWAEACSMLDRAERLHRQFFRPATIQSKPPGWEPPIDIYETPYGFKILVALPGVRPEHLQVILDHNHLHISGIRQLCLTAEAEIRRLEIPYGRFERTVELPAGHFEIADRELINGCLLIVLRKL